MVMRIQKTLLAVVSLAIVCVVRSGHSDGFILKDVKGHWEYFNETSQQAFIKYENGRETLLINVNAAAGEKGKGVWIFPVPAKPDGVTINIVKKLPMLIGYDYLEWVRRELFSRSVWLGERTLFLPVTEPNLVSSAVSRIAEVFRRLKGTPSLPPLPLGDYSGVSIFSHVEKEGIVTELIAAENGEAIARYTASKGLSIPSDGAAALDKYVGKGYAFVVTWIGSLDLLITRALIKENFSYYEATSPRFRELVHGIEQGYKDGYWKHMDSIVDACLKAVRADPSMLGGLSVRKGVCVSFPSPQGIYYPLCPTSVYGENVIPVSVSVKGFVTPHIPDSLKDYANVEYRMAYGGPDPDWDGGFFSGECQHTKVSINAPAKCLSEDLWVSPEKPLKLKVSEFIHNCGWFCSALQFFLAVFLCSIGSRMLVFRSWNGWRGAMLDGVTGCAMILSVFVCAMTELRRYVREGLTKLADTDILREHPAIRSYVFRRRNALFCLLLSIPLWLHVVCVCLAAVPWADPFGPPYEEPVLVLWASNLRSVHYGREGCLPLDVGILFAAIFLTGQWLRLRRVKASDRALFADLRPAGYSTWLLVPADKRHWQYLIVFFLLFQVVFILVTLMQFRLLR